MARAMRSGEIRAKLEAGGMNGLKRAAERVLEGSNARLPIGDPLVDPDPAVALRERGEVVRRAHGYDVIYDAAYAVKQHESMHLRHPRGGGPKYLEDALKASTAEGGVREDVRVEVSKKFGSDGKVAHDAL